MKKKNNTDRQKLIKKERVIESFKKYDESKNKVMTSLEQSVAKDRLGNPKFELFEVTNEVKRLRTKNLIVGLFILNSMRSVNLLLFKVLITIVALIVN